MTGLKPGALASETFARSAVLGTIAALGGKIENTTVRIFYYDGPRQCDQNGRFFKIVCN